MNCSTFCKSLPFLAFASIALFPFAAPLKADEPKAGQPVQEATLQLDGVVLTLEGEEAKLEPNTAGLIFNLGSAQLEGAEGAPRFWLGLHLGNVDDTLRLHLGIAPGTGLIVNGVENDSPAAKAGVMVNDLLLKLDGKSIACVDTLSAQIQEIGAKSVSLELLRRGKPAMLTVSPEQRPAQGLIFNLSNVHFAPEAVLTAGQFTISLEGENAVVEAEQGDLAKRVSEMMEQVKQLQKALEALDAAVKAQKK
jgi:membrane-associated protease RseP (regulator of RpoE activity)